MAKFRKVLSIAMVMCMLVSVLPMQALAASSVVTDQNTDQYIEGELVTDIVTTTTTTYDENGNPTVVVEFKETDTNGTAPDGAIVSGYKDTTTTTTMHPDGSVQVEVTEDGYEKKEYNDLEVQPGQKVPDITVELKEGLSSGKVDNSATPNVEKDGVGPGEGQTNYNQTITTTTTEREYEVNVNGMKEGFVVDGFNSSINCPVGPEDYEGKKEGGLSSQSKPYSPNVYNQDLHNMVDMGEFGVPEKPKDNEKLDNGILSGGHDFLLSGYGEFTEGAAPVLIKEAVWLTEVYVTDDSGNPVLDENGNPIIDLKKSVLDMEKTKFIEGQHHDLPTGMVGQTGMFALQHVNGEYFYGYCMDEANGMPKEGVWYELNNLEDAVYSSENPDGHLTEEQAAMIRAIAEKGYWGTDPNVYKKDAEGNVLYEDVKDADGNQVYETKYVNELDENGNIIIVEDKDGNRYVKRVAVEVPVRKPIVERDENGKPVTDPSVQGSIESLKQLLRDTYSVENGTNMISLRYPGSNDEQLIDITGLIDGLSEHEALVVTQAAIWAYANANDVKYVTPQGALLAVGDAVYGAYSGLKQFGPGAHREYDFQKDTNSDARMAALFQALINLDPISADSEKRKDTELVPDGDVFNEMALVIKDKAEEVADNEDDNADNDVYNTELSFTLAFVPDKNSDDLLVYLYNGTELMRDSNGDPIVRRLAGSNDPDGEQYEDVVYDEKTGIYTLTGLQMGENKDYVFNLQLQGTQHLDKGVYIYQAKGGRDASQTLVGMAEGDVSVQASATMTLNFEVTETNDVVVERVWHEEYDPITYPPQEPTTIEEEPVLYRLTNNQLEEIPDEEVPLSAPVTTGDNSIVSVIVMAMAMLMLLAINLPMVKRPHGKHEAI